MGRSVDRIIIVTAKWQFYCMLLTLLFLLILVLFLQLGKHIANALAYIHN